MKITYSGDDYWHVEQDGLHFVVRRHGGDGPDYVIDQDYWGHEEWLMSRLHLSHEQLFETMDNLIKEQND